MRLAPLAPLASLALLLGVTGCIVVPARQRPPQPPPRPVQLLTEQQAVDVAADFARARGYAIQRTTRAVLDAGSRWHVDLVGPDSHANVLVDAVSGRVLRSRLRHGAPPGPGSPPPAPPPGTAPPTGPGPERGQPRDDDWDE